MKEKSIKLPQFLAPDQVRKLIDHIRYFKHAAQVDIMFSLALRIAEVAAIKITDLDQDKQTIRINGKGKRQRILPCNERLWSLVIDVLQIYKPKLYLFENAFDQPYGTRQVRQMVYDGAQAAMIGHVHPHMLRHSKATQLVNNHVDIYRVQQLLGHAHIETTTVYLHLATNDLRSVLQLND